MKIKKGRWRIYQLLKSDKQLSNYLLEESLLDENSIVDLVTKHRDVEIMPCFGFGKIIVKTLKTNQYQIKNHIKNLVIPQKNQLYKSLISNEFIKEKRFYIVKPLDRSVGSPCFVTLRCKPWSSGWNVSIQHPLPTIRLNNQATRIAKQIAKKMDDNIEPDSTLVIKLLTDAKSLWISDIMELRPLSKWSQYKSVTSKKKNKVRLPDTAILTENSLYDFLQKYKQVFIKPCNGQWGKGIAQITLKDHDVYEIRYEKKAIEVTGFVMTYEFIQSTLLLNHFYLVQQKIKLARMDGNIFDIRVLIQLDPDCDSWVVNGALIKIAHDDYIVTNVTKKVLPLGEALEKLYGAKADLLKKKVEHASYHLANRFHHLYEDITIIGFDLGIDLEGNVWFIEANFKPDISMFYLLKDKGMHENIVNGIKKNKNKKTHEHVGDTPTIPPPLA